jgi:integrase
MIPASFSAIRGITARGSWPGSDSRHDDPCPLVTLRGYPAGGSRNQREPSRERSVLLISANLTGFHFHDLRHTGNTLAGAAGASLRELMERMGHRTSRAALIYQHRTCERDKLIADAIGKLAKAELRQRGRHRAHSGHGKASVHHDANGGDC